MTIFCKDCKHYQHKPYNHEEQYTGGDAYITEHRCNVIISLVTGKPEIRDANAMRNGVYKTNNCGFGGKLFEKNDDPNEGYVPNSLGGS